MEAAQAVGWTWEWQQEPKQQDVPADSGCWTERQWGEEQAQVHRRFGGERELKL